MSAGDAPKNPAPSAPPPQGGAGHAPAETGLERFHQAAANARKEEDSEVEMWNGGFSAKAMIGWWLIAAAITLACIIGSVFLPVGIPFFVAIAIIGWVLPALYLLYMRLSVRYRLTSQRFFHEHGIFVRTTDRVETIDIHDIQVSQGIVERILNVGTVRIKSSDPSHPWLELRGIDNVKYVAGKIDESRRKERIRRGLHIANV